MITIAKKKLLAHALLFICALGLTGHVGANFCKLLLKGVANIASGAAAVASDTAKATVGVTAAGGAPTASFSFGLPNSLGALSQGMPSAPYLCAAIALTAGIGYVYQQNKWGIRGAVEGSFDYAAGALKFVTGLALCATVAIAGLWALEKSLPTLGSGFEATGAMCNLLGGYCNPYPAVAASQS